MLICWRTWPSASSTAQPGSGPFRIALGWWKHVTVARLWGLVTLPVALALLPDCWPSLTSLMPCISCHDAPLLELLVKTNPLSPKLLLLGAFFYNRKLTNISPLDKYTIFFQLGNWVPLAALYNKQLLRRGCPPNPKSFPDAVLWPQTSLITPPDSHVTDTKHCNSIKPSFHGFMSYYFDTLS